MSISKELIENIRRVTQEKGNYPVSLNSEDVIALYDSLAAAEDKLKTALVIFGRVEDVWHGGAEDSGLSDDLSTMQNQIRKFLRRDAKPQEPITP